MLEELVGRTCGLMFEQTSQASFFKRYVTREGVQESDQFLDYPWHQSKKSCHFI